MLLAACCLGMSGCYVMQAARGQMAILARREPIADVLARPQTTPQLRARLEYVVAARDFAARELALPDNDTYRSYAALDRPYVVWNVFATDEFSVEPLRWCFPVAGCVVYRGYFSERGALRFARRLRRHGFDAAVGGVAAYSTLGHFKDPVLSTMLGWSDAQLAGTLFHELAHQVAYVPGDSEFNEAFATVVEETGLERWLEARGRPQELTAWRIQRERGAEFVSLLLRARERLRALYSSGLAVAEMRDRKQYELGRLKLEYRELRARWGGYAGYDAWFERTLTNAHLVSAATYYGCVPGLKSLLDAAAGDLPSFYAQVRALAHQPAAARAAAVCESAAPP